MIKKRAQRHQRITARVFRRNMKQDDKRHNRIVKEQKAFEKKEEKELRETRKVHNQNKRAKDKQARDEEDREMECLGIFKKEQKKF